MPETGIRYDQHQRIIDGNGKILVTNPDDPATGGYVTENQLKEWIEDVLAYPSASQFPSTGEDGRLYIAKDTNTLYRWDGSSYISVSADTSELELKVETLEAQVEDLETEVTSQQKVIADNKKDIAFLKFANEGKTYIMEESDRDGYSVDVKPSTVTGTAFGEAVLKSMEGRDVCWNQLARYISHSSYYKNGITFTYADGKLHANGTCNVTDWSYDGIQSFVDRSLFVDGHVVMLYGGTSKVGIGIRELGTSQKLKGEWGITKLANSTTSQLITFYESGVAYDDDIPFMVVDLTTLFGVTEVSQVTEAMKAQVRAYAEAHPEYNAGQIVNNNVTEVRSEGANLFTGEFILKGSYQRCSIGKPFSVSIKQTGTPHAYLGVAWGNNEDSLNIDWLVNNGTVAKTFRATPTGFSYYAVITFGDASSTIISNFDIMVVEGTYTETTMPKFSPHGIKGTLTLPSICSSLHGVGSARDKVSFVNKTYENMKSIDLGTLEWTREASGDHYIFTSRIPEKVAGLDNMLSSVYGVVNVVSGSDVPNMCMRGHASGTIVIIRNDSKTSAPSLSDNWLSGVIVHYQATSGGQRYEARVMERKMGMIDIYDSNLSYDNGWGSFRIRGVPSLSPSNTPIQVPSLLCSKYATVAYGIDFPDKTISAWNSLGNSILIRDDSYGTDAVALKEALAGVKILYPLATPQLLDITSEVPEEPSIPIEDGGTLTFVNENKVATPSRISMPVKLGGTV